MTLTLISYLLLDMTLSLNPSEPHRLRYDQIERVLEGLGYLVTGLECNTANYGLPQQRSRAWLMCILKSQSLFKAVHEMPRDLELFQCQPLSLELLISETLTHGADSKSSKPANGKSDAKWKEALKEIYKRLGKASWDYCAVSGCGWFSP